MFMLLFFLQFFLSLPLLIVDTHFPVLIVVVLCVAGRMETRMGKLGDLEGSNNSPGLFVSQLHGSEAARVPRYLHTPTWTNKVTLENQRSGTRIILLNIFWALMFRITSTIKAERITTSDFHLKLEQHETHMYKQVINIRKVHIIRMDGDFLLCLHSFVRLPLICHLSIN